MSAKKRVSRRDLLKKPDEFIVFTQRVINYVGENQKTVLGVVGAVAIAALIAGAFHMWGKSDRRQAQVLEEEGNRLFAARQRRGVYGMDQVKPVEDIKRALDKYREIIQNYPQTPFADRAQVYIGDCYFRLKQFGDAERNYLQYLEKHPEKGFFTTVVKQSLGYVYDAKGDYNKAIMYFTAASEDIPEEERVQTYMDVARCYEEMGKFGFAVDYYQKVLQNAERESGSKGSPQFRSSMVDLDRVKGKIAQLKPRS